MKSQRRKRYMLLMESLMISILLMSACGGSSSQGAGAAANNPALVTETSTSGTEASTGETEPTMSESETSAQESTTEAEGKDETSVETMTPKKETEGDDSKESSKSDEPVVTVYTEQDLEDQELIVYTDPEVHEVVYNKNTGESMRFISGELIEHGIESISLPAEMFESEKDIVPITDPEFDPASLEEGLVYDLSDIYYPPCKVIATKNYRFFSTTYRVDKVINLESVVLKIAPQFATGSYEENRRLVNISEFTVVEHSDGAKDYLIWVTLLNRPWDELHDDKGNITITGGQHSVGVLIRPRGKQIQAMYFAVAEGSPGYWDKKLMEYILLHSIKYTEKLESTLRYITEDYMREGYKNNPNIDFDLVFPED